MDRSGAQCGDREGSLARRGCATCEHRRHGYRARDVRRASPGRASRPRGCPERTPLACGLCHERCDDAVGREGDRRCRLRNCEQGVAQRSTLARDMLALGVAVAGAAGAAVALRGTSDVRASSVVAPPAAASLGGPGVGIAPIAAPRATMAKSERWNGRRRLIAHSGSTISGIAREAEGTFRSRRGRRSPSSSSSLPCTTCSHRAPHRRSSDSRS